MKWIVFYQTLNDNVCYITSDMTDVSYKEYKDFVDFILKFCPNNTPDLIDHLDKFSTVFFNTETRLWEVEESYVKEENDLDILIKFKEKREKKNATTSKDTIKKLKGNTKSLLKNLKQKDKSKGKIKRGNIFFK